MSALATFETSNPLTLLTGDAGPDEWAVRESARARRLTVRVYHSGRVEVVVPRRTSQRTVEQFLARHRDWIERRREAARRNARPPQPFPPQTIELAASGEKLRVHLAGGKGATRVHLLAPGLLGITGNAAQPMAIRKALRSWLTVKAKHVLEPLLAQAARDTGTSYKRLTIRRQRTRWGSCSSHGTISLNCCLLFQRPEVVRYLLIHELAHTVHMNHSKRFWAAVARHCPDFQALDRELLEGWKSVPSWVIEE